MGNGEKRAVKAVGNYVVVEILKAEEKITKAGIVVVSQDGQHTTNEGSKVSDDARFKVVSIGSEVLLNIQIGDELIVNPWTVQVFEVDEKTYAAIPASEIKAIV